MNKPNYPLFDNTKELESTEQEVIFIGIPLVDSYLGKLEIEMEIKHIDEENLEERILQFAKIIEERKPGFETLKEKYENVLFLMRFFVPYSVFEDTTPKDTIDKLLKVKKIIDSKENLAREANMYRLKLYEQRLLDSIEDKRINNFCKEILDSREKSLEDDDEKKNVLYKGPSDPECEDPAIYFKDQKQKIVSKITTAK
jgi:hypothetical protein